MKKAFQTYQDSELCSSLRAGGDEKNLAFAELYRRHHQRLYAYILKISGDVDDTNDLFQETFVRFMRSVEHSEEIIENIGGFLMRTARNLCLNYKRDQKQTVAIEDFHLVQAPAAGYEQEELLSLIRTALECLDAEYREAFVLRLYHDLSYEEMAEVTGASVAALKNRVWRAKEKIRTILSPILADFDRI